MENILFIKEVPSPGNHAGNKARMDVNRIFLEELGTSEYGYQERKFSSVVEKIKYVLNLHNMCELYRLYSISGDNLFMQYPFYGNPILKSVLEHIANQNNVILVVHDVDALRDFGQARINKEIALFNKCRACIVHNQYMKKALEELGVTAPMIILGVFDYLRSSNEAPKRLLDHKIAFAGNLSKSKFIVKLDNLPEIFYLYGPGADTIGKMNNVVYKGSFSPDEIPQKLEGSFGLIWDGDSVESCEGSFGQYMKYNNPHKLSLYISAGLPVIVWSKAAISDFVREHNIGFCVDSLEDIHEKISNIEPSDYEFYLSNVASLQKKVTQGSYMKKAIKAGKKFLVDV